jgi:plastocyanin
MGLNRAVKLLVVFALLSSLAVACGGYAATTQPTAAPANTAAAGNTAAPAPTAAPSSSSAVTIQNFSFAPAQLSVKVGTTVTWTNQDSAAHTVAADDGSWTSGDLAKGQAFTHTFDKAGTFAYHCGVHPSMKGTITVTQ